MQDALKVFLVRDELLRLEVMFRGWPYVPVQLNGGRVEVAELTKEILLAVEIDGCVGHVREESVRVVFSTRRSSNAMSKSFTMVFYSAERKRADEMASLRTSPTELRNATRMFSRLTFKRIER